MKKCCMLLWGLLLVLALCAASADTLPPDLAAQHIDYPQDVADCLVFDLPEERQLAVTYGTWGSLDGYLRTGDTWEIQFMLSGSAENARLQRLEEDMPAFELVSLEDESLELESWRFTDAGIQRTGWACRGDWQGRAAVQDGMLVYIAADGTTEQVPYETDWQLAMVDHDSLPMSPDEARALLTIAQPNAPQYPDFTLIGYASFNSGKEAETQYVRIVNNCVTFRTETLRAGEGVARTTDSMPVPVTDTLAQAVAERGAQAVFSTDDTGKPFALAAWLDRSRVPVTGAILQSDAQACGLVLLTEEAGVRRLAFVTRGIDGSYSVQTSKPLPEGTWLDLFHAGEGEVQPEFADMQLGYRLDAQGLWQLSWLMGSGFTASVTFGRVTSFDGDDASFIGSLSAGDLMTADLTALPRTKEALAEAIDSTSWAVVTNPDPNDRLHLRTAPKRGADSLGKFYNGTTVRVLERSGDWTRVCLDQDGLLTGWMMTKYLTFGAEGAAVTSVDPGKLLLDHIAGANAFTTAWRIDSAALTVNGSETIIGLIEAEGVRPASYIIRSSDGQTGYVPQEWYWDGNG